jgi:drug/metabolite transporter (DMT)-like permease
MRLRYAPDLALVAITAIWGFTFVSVKDAIAVVPDATHTTPFVFLALRFWLAFVVFGLVVPSAWRGLRRPTLTAGIVAGALFFAGYAFQTVGLSMTTPAHAGFITGLFVVLTPVFASLLLKRVPRGGTLAGVAFGTLGLLLLTGGFRGDSMNRGDVIVFGCAVAFALHIIALSRFSSVDWAPLAWVQMLVTAVGSTIGALVAEPLVLPAYPGVWWAVAVTAVLATAVALSTQTWAQRHVGPTRTALILILEPVFAGLFAYLLWGERLGVAGWLGSGLIVSGMLVSELSRVMADRRAVV